MTKLEKLTKKLGKDTTNVLDEKSVDGLKNQIVVSEQAMETVQAELEANPKYQELKDSLAALQAGKREVNARQRAIIAYSLIRLADLGVAQND